ASSVSVVDAQQMLEVARIATCVMPHGSRVSPDGAKHYSACMMSDLLVEIDAQRMKVARTFRVTRGAEKGYMGLAQVDAANNGSKASDAHEGHDGAAPAMPMQMSADACMPTWAQPSVDGKNVYVACNKSNEIVEVNTETWTLRRRIPA